MRQYYADSCFVAFIFEYYSSNFRFISLLIELSFQNSLIFAVNISKFYFRSSFYAIVYTTIDLCNCKSGKTKIAIIFVDLLNVFMNISATNLIYKTEILYEYSIRDILRVICAIQFFFWHKLSLFI